MGGKNRAKKKEGSSGASSTKKAAGIKVSNKASNKAAKARGIKDLEARGGNVQDKKSKQASNKSDRASARKSEGVTAESKKKKRSHGSKTGGAGPSVKQMKQHAHEPRAMSKHDASYNARQQAKADKRAGRGAGGAEGEDAGEEEDPNADEEIDADSLHAHSAYFQRNAGLAGFLDNLSESDLKTWGKEERAKPKLRMPERSKQQQAEGNMSDEEGSDADDDDDDDDAAEDESEEEEDGPSKKKPRGEKGVASFERTPRLPSWAKESKAAKDRMPVRNADGSWGASEVTKADTLRARAERIEKMQQRAAGKGSDDEADQHDSANDDDDDADGDEAMANADADASDAEGSEDDYNNEDEEDEDDMEGELEMEEVHIDAASAAAAAAASSPAAAAAPSSRDVAEAQSARRYRLKLEIAESSELILENPEKHLGRLEPVLQLMGDPDTVVQQLAMLSATEVLIDLMPTYRIRLPTDEEAAANLSKDTKQLWKFERNYLLYYGRLVTTLLSYTKRLFPASSNNNPTLPPLGLSLLKCQAKLLERGYHFNYRKELIAGLIGFMNHVSPVLRLIVFQSVVAVFRSDIAGESTLEIVRHLARTIKEKGRRVQAEVLQVLLYLPLHKEIIQAQIEEKKAPEVKKKGNSYIKLDDPSLKKDLAEGEATVSLATRKKIQTQALTLVFSSYFRILKQQRNAKVLPIVLRGLSKFATLIDIELVLDLLDCLKATINPENQDEEANGGALSLDSTLYCILTSFQTLQSHGQALNLDLKEFYNCLYGLLYRFADPSAVEHIPLLLQCLHLMFHETKQLSIERVASFVKRLASLSLYLPPYASLAILHALRLILNKYPKSKALLDREATASGLHLAEIDDPDLANSFAGTLWELGLHKCDYHPFLPIYAQSVLTDEALPLALARTTPQQLFENYDASEGGFNPPLPLPQLFTASSGSGSSAPTSASMRKKLDLKRRIQMAALSASRTNERLQSPFLKACTEHARKRPRDGSVAGAAQTAEQSSLPQLSERLKGLKSISALYRKHRSQQQQQQQQRQKSAQQPKSNGRAPAATAAASSQPKSKSQKAQPHAQQR